MISLVDIRHKFYREFPFKQHPGSPSIAQQLATEDRQNEKVEGSSREENSANQISAFTVGRTAYTGQLLTALHVWSSSMANWSNGGAKGGSKSHTCSHINPLNTTGKGNLIGETGRHKLPIASPVTPVASVLLLLRQHRDNPDLTAFDILKMSGIALLYV